MMWCHFCGSLTSMTEHRTITLHQGYGSSYNDLDEIISNAVARLGELDFDTLAGTGMSGSIVIPLLARALDKHFLLIRKDGAGAHTDAHVGVLGERWLFVDDFISSGATKQRVADAVADIVKTANRWLGASQVTERYAPVYVGDYLYAPWDGPKFLPAPEPKPEPADKSVSGFPGCPCDVCQGGQPF